MAERACLDCGQLLVKKPGPGRWPKRCPVHQAEAVRRGRRPPGWYRVLGVRRCEWCDHEFEWFHGSTGKYCSVQCSAWGNSKVRSCLIPEGVDPRFVYSEKPLRIDSGTCQWCARWMFRPASHKRFCSTECKARWHGARSPVRVYFIKCGDCGELFTARDGRTRFCSEDCWPSGRKWQISNRRRQRIYERDQWCCQLCGERVDRRAKFTDRAPSLDHIVPRSMGGGDDDANLQLAHRWCNSYKGDRIDGEQLLLVG